jgi:MFS family permease
MASALGTFIAPIMGGVLYENLGVQNACNVFAASSIFMAFLFFIMNIWPGFLLSPKLDIKEQNSLMGEASAKSQAALEEKAHESRIIKSIRGSAPIDMVIPSSMEHKKYLAHIDEDDDDEEFENENENDSYRK